MDTNEIRNDLLLPTRYFATYIGVIVTLFLTLYGTSYWILLAASQISFLIMLGTALLVSMFYIIGITVCFFNVGKDGFGYKYYNNTIRVVMILLIDFALPVLSPIWVLGYIIAIAVTKNDLIIKTVTAKVSPFRHWLYKLTFAFVHIFEALFIRKHDQYSK